MEYKKYKAISYYLHESLKHLEGDKIITKHLYAEIPPKVEYLLTEKGQELVPALKIIEEWSKNQFSDILNK